MWRKKRSGPLSESALLVGRHHQSFVLHILSTGSLSESFRCDETKEENTQPGKVKQGIRERARQHNQARLYHESLSFIAPQHSTRTAPSNHNPNCPVENEL